MPVSFPKQDWQKNEGRRISPMSLETMKIVEGLPKLDI